MKTGDKVKILAVEGLMGPEYLGAIGTIREKIKKKFNVYVDDGNFFELGPKSLELVDQTIELVKENTAVFVQPLQAPQPTKVVEQVGIKHDSGKPQLDLVPASLEESVGQILTMGAKKYAAHNWRNGINYSRIVASLKRHLNEFYKGNLIDEESGKPHLWHVGCNVAFLIEFESKPTKYAKFNDLYREDK
jgi:hypothetical protein